MRRLRLVLWAAEAAPTSRAQDRGTAWGTRSHRALQQEELVLTKVGLSRALRFSNR